MMDDRYDGLLKNSGLKLTKQRRAILAALDKINSPLSAEQVYLALNEAGTDINLSTVYRSLEQLSEKKLIVKLDITGEDRALFELNTKKHRHYLICLSCRKITAIESCPLISYEEKLAEQTNYEIAGHRLDIYGYCPECKDNNLHV